MIDVLVSLDYLELFLIPISITHNTYRVRVRSFWVRTVRRCTSRRWRRESTRRPRGPLTTWTSPQRNPLSRSAKCLIRWIFQCQHLVTHCDISIVWKKNNMCFCCSVINFDIKSHVLKIDIEPLHCY